MATIVTGTGPMSVHDLPQEDDGPRLELVDGSLLVTPMARLQHQRLVADIVRQLSADALLGDAAVLPGVNVIADDRTLVIPDVAVVTGEAAARDTLGVTPEDLVVAVEVESESTRRRDRTLKRALYAEWGVAYWLVDPVEGTVTRFPGRDGDVPLTSPAVRAQR